MTAMFYIRRNEAIFRNKRMFKKCKKIESLIFSFKSAIKHFQWKSGSITEILFVMF